MKPLSDSSPSTHVAILMGVSGVGKTSVGAEVATRLGWTFYDADHFHSEANKAKMRRGAPLNDDDRAGWLESLHALIGECLREGRSAILACSALKDRYREILLKGNAGAFVVYLRAERDVVAERIGARTGHYFDPGLLDSQYAALEEPSDCIVIDAARPLAVVVDAVLARLHAVVEGVAD